MEEQAISKDKATRTVHEIEKTDSELYKIGIYTTAAFAGGIGLWAVICFSSTFLSENDPVGLAKNMFGAISGSI